MLAYNDDFKINMFIKHTDWWNILFLLSWLLDGWMLMKY